jgi:hypothetical protein
MFMLLGIVPGTSTAVSKLPVLYKYALVSFTSYYRSIDNDRWNDKHPGVETSTTLLHLLQELGTSTVVIGRLACYKYWRTPPLLLNATVKFFWPAMTEVLLFIYWIEEVPSAVRPVTCLFTYVLIIPHLDSTNNTGVTKNDPISVQSFSYGRLVQVIPLDLLGCTSTIPGCALLLYMPYAS